MIYYLLHRRKGVKIFTDYFVLVMYDKDTDAVFTTEDFTSEHLQRFGLDMSGMYESYSPLGRVIEDSLFARYKVKVVAKNIFELFSKIENLLFTWELTK